MSNEEKVKVAGMLLLCTIAKSVCAAMEAFDEVTTDLEDGEPATHSIDLSALIDQITKHTPYKKECVQEIMETALKVLKENADE